MPVTVSALEKVNPRALAVTPGTLAAVDGQLGAAAGVFDGGVRTVVDGGHAWRGNGQPEASAVARTNSVALAVTRYQAQAAQAAVAGLVSGLTKAHANLLAPLGVARSKGYRVDDDGHVESFGEVTEYDHQAVDEQLEARRLTSVIQATLAFATLVDSDASTLLDRIAGTTPQFTDVADGAAADRNSRALDAALENRTLAQSTQQLWEAAAPTSWQDFMNQADRPFDVGDFLTFFQGLKQGAGLVLTGAGLDATGTGVTPTTVADYLTASLARFGIVVRAPTVGAAAITAGIGFGVWKAGQAVVKDPTPAQPPNRPAVAAPTVDDPRLYGLVDSYFFNVDKQAADPGGSGTLGDLARYERATGTRVVGIDHVAQAREVLAGLRQWNVDHSNGKGVSDRDYATFVYLQGELEDALLR